MKNNTEFITALNEYNVSRKVNVNESIDERRTRLIWLSEDKIIINKEKENV